MKKKNNKKPLPVGSQRGIGGLKEMELARMAGVSRSTVQRWKRGTSNNEKLMKTLQGVLEEQLRDKIKTIKDYHEENDLPTSHFERVGEKLLGDLENNDVVSELTISKLEKLLSSKTSTVTGEDAWRENVRSAAERTFGLEGERLESALDAFNSLLEDNVTRIYLEGKYNNGMMFDSKQRVKAISKIFGDKRYKGDYGRIYEKTKQNAKDWYEKNKDETIIW